MDTKKFQELSNSLTEIKDTIDYLSTQGDPNEEFEIMVDQPEAERIIIPSVCKDACKNALVEAMKKIYSSEYEAFQEYMRVNKP